MPHKSSLLLLVVGVLMLTTNVLQAREYGENKFDDAARQLGRGIGNITLSPIEVLNSMFEITVRDGEMAGATYGVFRGLGRAGVRIGVGVFEIVTFPAGREPRVLPEFVARGGIINQILVPHKNHGLHADPDDWQFPVNNHR